MNIIYFVSFLPNVLGSLVYFLLLNVISIVSFFLIFPFCSKSKTIDAKNIWFAWHPVILGGLNDNQPVLSFNLLYNIKNTRWLITVWREVTDKSFADNYLYRDITDNDKNRDGYRWWR